MSSSTVQSALFQNLCIRASDEKWCWSLTCTTCYHERFRKSFELIAKGIDPTSDEGQELLNAPVVSRPGSRPMPKLKYTEAEKLAVIHDCAETDLAFIASKCVFPDWLGYLGLILHHMKTRSDEFLNLQKKWSNQFGDLVQPGSEAWEVVEQCARVGARPLKISDLEIFERDMRPEFCRYRT